MGLLFSKSLFTRAASIREPPKTGMTCAPPKKITALGDGIAGYGDTAEQHRRLAFHGRDHSLGGEVAVKDGDKWKAAFNNDKGKQVLRQLHDMRWTDNSMGERQLLEYADLIQMMASGKLGMYLATGDNLKTIVNQYKGNYNDYGLGPMPGGQGTLAGVATGSCSTPSISGEDPRRAAVVAFSTQPERLTKDYDRRGQPNPVVCRNPTSGWCGGNDRKDANTKLANVPVENFKPFATAHRIALKLEPPTRSKSCGLDTAMQKVLTDQNAMSTRCFAAETQVNSILAAVT